MQLPSAADLVRAFVKDLGNVFENVFDQDTPTITVYIYSTGGASTLWVSDADYILTNVTCDGGTGINIVVTFDNSTYAANHATGVAKKGAILATFSSNAGQNHLQTTPVQSGQKIYVNNASASNAAVMLFLKKA